LAALTAAPSGCQWGSQNNFKGKTDKYFETLATTIEYPAESACTLNSNDPALGSPPPLTLLDAENPEYWNLSLPEVIEIALQNSTVLHQLGGTVIRAPDTVRTTYDPAIAESDPRFGVEAALSAFDAQFQSSVFWEKNHRALNNEFFGGGTRILFQDASVFQAAITKTAATGSQFTVRHNVDYDGNNAPGNLIPSAWDANVEAEARQPLLQGAGLEFNRIAGPFSTPGIYNGVLVARINTDVALVDFEIAVRDLMSNVENAYWDLYYGYRDLNAKVQARDEALKTWRSVYARFETGRTGGEAANEAQAREQYFRFQEEVQTALSGELLDGTRVGNGTGGGIFRPTGGVLVAERRLRVLMGLSPTDGKLIRPSDEPVMAKVDFDWQQSAADTAVRRAELRRQKWNIRRRELELIASKNFLMPRLDAIGRYRWRGFGDDLTGNESGDLGQFNSAYGNLATGNFQEWQLGLEFSLPIGFRQAHAGVRNAELLLARDRALLRDQQRDAIRELSDAVAETDRTFVVAQTTYNRLIASRQQHEALLAPFEENKEVSLDLLLDAQRRLLESEVRYYRALAEYALAVKNVHFVKGTLLDYDGVYLTEGPWPGEAYRDAADLESMRGKPRPLNYASQRAPVVGWGEMPQEPAGVPCETSGDIPGDLQPSAKTEYDNEPATALVPTTVTNKTAPAPTPAPITTTKRTAPPAAVVPTTKISPSGLVPATAIDRSSAAAVTKPAPFPMPTVTPKRLPPAPPTTSSSR
ncbi:MAG: TolC family protein, partial [Pirellulales bacterium]